MVKWKVLPRMLLQSRKSLRIQFIIVELLKIGLKYSSKTDF